jgi:hypothetical protein
LGKPYGIRPRCYWEHIGNTFENLTIFWEHAGWKHIANKGKNKNNSPHPQKEKQDPLRVHDEPSHWLHEISLSKIIDHHF